MPRESIPYSGPNSVNPSVTALTSELASLRSGEPRSRRGTLLQHVPGITALRRAVNQPQIKRLEGELLLENYHSKVLDLAFKAYGKDEYSDPQARESDQDKLDRALRWYGEKEAGEFVKVLHDTREKGSEQGANAQAQEYRRTAKRIADHLNALAATKQEEYGQFLMPLVTNGFRYGLYGASL